MSSTSTAAENPNTALDRKRIFIYKAFLVLAIINNSLLAAYCLIFGGGSFFSKAPSWAVLTLGALGAVTVLCSIAALAWKKLGIYGMTAAGASAAIVAAVIKLFPASITFVIGTVFLLLIARHQWSRLE